MAHPDPPHHPDLPYTGQHAYFLTFCTYERKQIFTGGEPVDIVVTQILRAAECKRFDLPDALPPEGGNHKKAPQPSRRLEAADPRRFVSYSLRAAIGSILAARRAGR